MMLINLCAETIKAGFEGDKSDGSGRNTIVYHVYPVSHTTGEGRAECSKGGGGRGNSQGSLRLSVRARCGFFKSKFLRSGPVRL